MLVDLRLLYSLEWVVWDALPVFRFKLFFAQPSVVWKQGCGAAFNNQPLRAPGMSVEQTGVNAALNAIVQAGVIAMEFTLMDSSKLLSCTFAFRIVAAFINLRRILARQRRRGMMEGSRIVV